MLAPGIGQLRVVGGASDTRIVRLIGSGSNNNPGL
jgi:hypothetical protein